MTTIHRVVLDAYRPADLPDFNVFHSVAACSSASVRRVAGGSA